MVERITRDGRVGQVDATLVPRFAGPPTFARLPRIDEVSDVDVAVLGVPFDSGVSYRPGARFGPAHVRESSRLLRPYNPAQDVEPFRLQQVVDAGDLGVNPFSIDEAIGQYVEPRLTPALLTVFFFSISLGVLKQLQFSSDADVAGVLYREEADDD